MAQAIVLDNASEETQEVMTKIVTDYLKTFEAKRDIKDITKALTS